MLAVLLGLPVSLAQPRRLRSKLFFLSLPIIATGLLYSFVRGAMLGLAVGLLYLAFHRYKILVYGIPFVLVAALFLPSGAVLTRAVFSSNSLQDRTFSWGDRFELFAAHPFGTGVGTTGAAAEKAAKLKFQDPDATYVPDNSWLKVLFEIGVFGLWFFVMMVVSIFLFFRDVERRTTGIDRDFVNGAVAQLARDHDRGPRGDVPRARADGPAVLAHDRRGRDHRAGARTRTGDGGRDGPPPRRRLSARAGRPRRSSSPVFRPFAAPGASPIRGPRPLS